MAILSFNRTAGGRRALAKTWRPPSVRCQHAEPATKRHDDHWIRDSVTRPLEMISENAGSRHYRPTDPQQRRQGRESLSQLIRRGVRDPHSSKGGTDSTARRQQIKTDDGPLRVERLKYVIDKEGPLMLSPAPEMPGFDPPFVGADGQLKAHGKSGTFTVPGRWLREMCTCSECRHPDTAQKKVNVLQGSRVGSVVYIKKLDPEKTEDPEFEVTFADGHRSNLRASTIQNRNKGPIMRARRTASIPITPWKADVASHPPSVEYTSVKTRAGMAALLLKIRQFGFCFISHTPPSPHSTERLLQTIGPLRTTHYGGFYDFTSDLSSKDTAYTSEALPPHTDNTYFTEPSGLQALHLLSHSSADAEPRAGAWEPHLGGESVLVDGFAAADHLFHANPAAYRTLSAFGVHAHASGNHGVSIQPDRAYPPFQHDCFTGKLTQVRWNTADRAGTTVPWEHMDAWYDAAAEFDGIVNRAAFQYWFPLKPGTLLLFDNWRVLHGRAAFTGMRRMCGGYIPRDDFISKFKATNLSSEEVQGSTVTG